MAPIREDKKSQDVRDKLNRFCNAASHDKHQSPPRMYESATHTDTAKVLDAIAESHTYLLNRIDEVKVDISLLGHDMLKLRERVTETETHVSVVEDTIAPRRPGSPTEIYSVTSQN